MTTVPHTLPLPTPDEIAAWDHTAIHDFGLRQEVLMETAGRGAFAVIEEALEDVSGLRALILAGSGNNGGDAFVVARCLSDAGAQVLVLHTGRKKKYRGASATNLRLAQKMGLELIFLGDEDLQNAAAPLGQPDIIVDGLLGTGFKGILRPKAQAWIEGLNILGEQAFTLAVDIPSGLCGETGRPQPLAVVADATVTFQAPKLGLAQPEAPEFCGMIHVHPIGIPGFVMRSAPTRCALLTLGTMDLLPTPAPDMHKGQAGHVLVIGGSEGLTGAPLLCAQGALRSGAGLVTIACPAGLANEIKANNPDVMTLPLGRGTKWTPSMSKALKKELPRFDAVALGPGLGRDKGALEFLQDLYAQPLPPLVMDADALYWLAQEPTLLAATASNAILTPHPGEAARLTGTQTAQIQDDRLATAQKLSATFGTITVLKGAGTIIASPDSRTWLSPLSVPNLAVAGSGDVLTGLTACMLAKGLSPVQAACLGVYWHGLAGEILQEQYPMRGNLASDIATVLPTVFEE